MTMVAPNTLATPMREDDLAGASPCSPGLATAVTPAVISVVYGQSGDELHRFVSRLATLGPRPAAIYLVNNEPGRQISEEVRGAADGAVPVVNLDMAENVGFSRAVNAAVKAARNDGHALGLVLNTDIEFNADDLLARLGSALEEADCDFISPGIVCWPETDKVWYRGATCRRPAWVTRHPGIGRRWSEAGRGVVPTDVGCSCCMLVSLETFERLGGFEQRLFMYFEDAELALRAHAAGSRTMLLDEPLVAHHKEGRRLGATEAYFFGRNPLLLIRWHERGWRRAAGTCIHLVATVAYLGRARRRVGARRACLRGLRDGFAGRCGPSAR